MGSKLLDVKNKKVTVIGAARSGTAVALLLKKHGAIVFVSDMAEETKLQDFLHILKSNNIAYETGTHSQKVFDCSLIVISPGVPSNSPIILEALSRGIMVISEVELAYNFCKSNIIAITGSNGKTTTTTLIGKIFEMAGKDNIVAGNIGVAFSSVVESLSENSTIILEVSSFQLDHVYEFKPKISIFLNISPDHMDRYDNSLEKYTAAKSKIFMNQDGNDYLIYNYDDPIVAKSITAAKCICLPFSIKVMLEYGAYIDWEKRKLVVSTGKEKVEVINIDDIGIKGIHNLYNSLAAVLASRLMNISVNSIALALKEFQGVEHRLEFVREIDSVKYVNDSKATNVDSVWYALTAFENPIILLLGGRDKGNDYSKLKSIVKDKVKKIIAIGESAEKVKFEFQNDVCVEIASSMQEAVEKAKSSAAAGDIVLLSPACASFDWFKNYEHRGSVFKEIVRNL